MSPAWKQLQIFRNLPAAPEYLTITAWGRQFRVAPPRTVRRTPGFANAEVTVEIVGPTLAPKVDAPAPLRLMQLCVCEEPDDDITDVRPPSPQEDVVELVYEEQDGVTADGPMPASPSRVRTPSTKGGRRGA